MIYGFVVAFYSGLPGLWVAEKLRKKDSTLFHSVMRFQLTENVNLYKLVGLDFFVFCIKNTFFKHLNKKIKITKRLNLSEANNLLYEMTVSEICHLVGFLIVILFQIVFFFMSERMDVLISSTIFNIIFNLYPVLVQERNKLRIRKFITLIERRNQTAKIKR